MVMENVFNISYDVKEASCTTGHAGCCNFYETVKTYFSVSVYKYECCLLLTIVGGKSREGERMIFYT